MSQQIKDLKPLFLSAEEAMGLLDLCILSQADFDRDTEGLLLKLSDLVRQHLASMEDEAGEICTSGGDDPRPEPEEGVQEPQQYADSGGIALPGVELAAAAWSLPRRPALKPCPARRFRSWTTTPAL